MGNTDSASSIKAASSWTHGSSNPSVNTDKVFHTNLFETYVSRVVRLHLGLQYLDEDNQVIVDERRLIEQAREPLQKHLADTVPAWKMNWCSCKMVIVKHLRKLAGERITIHDIDDETRDETLERFFREDFESLWPRDWLDS
jgi:hypothetical protein